jgi:hypothetical protein
LLGPQFLKYNLRSIDRDVRDRLIKFKQFAKEAIMSQIEKVKNKCESDESNIFNGVIEHLIKEGKLKQSSTEN